MNLIFDLLIEAFVVGVLLLLLYKFIHSLFDFFGIKSDYTFDVILFISGFLFHILCEITGVNNWYLTNSVAYKTSTYLAK